MSGIPARVDGSAFPSNGLPNVGQATRDANSFFEPISSRWVARSGEQPIAQWVRGVPENAAGLSMINRWPGTASAGSVVAQIEAELRGSANTPIGSGSLVDQLRAEGDDIKLGYAMGQLAADIERRIMAHLEVPSGTAGEVARELRLRGSMLSYGAARDATTAPDNYAYKGRCYPNSDALVAAVRQAQANPNGPVLREYTPQMAQRDRLAAMDRQVLGEGIPGLGLSWGQTAYMYARGSGASPERLERAYAMGTLADAAIGVAGSVAGAGVARTGFRAPGAQAGPLVDGGRVAVPTEPVLGPTAAVVAKGSIGGAKALGIPTFLNPRQELHVPPVTDGRSVLDLDPAALLRGLHNGDFVIVRQPKQGQAIVDFGKPIGEYWSNGAKVGPTQFGSISFGRRGAHIIPANPHQW